MRYLYLAVIVLSSWVQGGEALAQPQVSVTVDGVYYGCNGGTGPTDPTCLSKVSTWCNSQTSYTSTACYDKASQACKGSGSGYGQCVTDSAAYCSANTSYTSTACFDKALDACKGSASSMRDLMDAVKSQAASSFR